MPKVRSLTGGTFGEADPTSWHNSVLHAKAADETITYEKWKASKYELYRETLSLEGKDDDFHLHGDDASRKKLFLQIDPEHTQYQTRYAPELPSFIETLFVLWYRRKMRFKYVHALAYKWFTMFKMVLGIWDEQLIYDTQAHIYKNQFYVHSDNGAEDQLNDLVMIGTSHSLFWMFLPYQPLAIFTKLGEASNASPTYVAETPGVKAQSAFLGKSDEKTLLQFLVALLFDWTPANAGATLVEGAELLAPSVVSDLIAIAGPGEEAAEGAAGDAEKDGAGGIESENGDEERRRDAVAGVDEKEMSDWLSDGHRLLQGLKVKEDFYINGKKGKESGWIGRGANMAIKHFKELCESKDGYNFGDAAKLHNLGVEHGKKARALVDSRDESSCIEWQFVTKKPEPAELKHKDEEVRKDAELRDAVYKNDSAEDKLDKVSEGDKRRWQGGGFDCTNPLSRTEVALPYLGALC